MLVRLETNKLTAVKLYKKGMAGQCGGADRLRAAVQTHGAIALALQRSFSQLAVISLSRKHFLNSARLNSPGSHLNGWVALQRHKGSAILPERALCVTEGAFGRSSPFAVAPRYIPRHDQEASRPKVPCARGFPFWQRRRPTRPPFLRTSADSL